MSDMKDTNSGIFENQLDAENFYFVVNISLCKSIIKTTGKNLREKKIVTMAALLLRNTG